MRACTSAYAFFCGECGAHLNRCYEHHACAGVYVRQVLWTSEYTFDETLATRCAYALIYMQFGHLALGIEDGGVQLVYASTSCLAWGVVFDRRKNRGVVGVFSIFNAGGSVCGCMCVYTHTHTQCKDVSSGVGMMWAQESGWDTWGPEEFRWTKSWDTYICICVQSIRVHVCARRRDEILDQLLFSLTYFFFPKRKVKHLNANHR